MEPYKNLNHDSNVTAFEIGSDRINVRFIDHKEYLYTNESAGAIKIEQMKVLAISGSGLNSYINRHAKKLYASKR